MNNMAKEAARRAGEETRRAILSAGISAKEAAENIRRALQNYPSAEDIIRALNTKALQRQKEAAEAHQ